MKIQVEISHVAQRNLVKASKMFQNLSLAASVVTGREGDNHEQKTHFSITFLNVFTDEQAFLCRQQRMMFS